MSNNALSSLAAWLPTAGSYADAPFFLMAGPCAIEDDKTPFEVAEKVVALCQHYQIPYIFKGSFKKANRTRKDSFTGIGNEKALEILAAVSQKHGVPTVTDIHEREDAALAAQYVDVLQIPAFLCRQTELLIAAGETGKVVNIKKGQFVSAAMMGYAAQKVQSTGNPKVLLTERGTTFGYQDLVVDYRNIPWMQALGLPVVLDITHSLQQPNQTIGVTGGHPELIETIALAGAAIGVNGFFLETHPEPSRAKSDAANMLPLAQLPALLERMVRIAKTRQGF